MNWREVNHTQRADWQLQLDDIAARFMLSTFARPSVLFEKTPERQMSLGNYSLIQPNKESHMYLADIFTHLCDTNFNNLYVLNQLKALISDLDLLFKPGTTRSASAYQAPFDGINKFNHADFTPMRESYKRYHGRSLTNDTSSQILKTTYDWTAQKFEPVPFEGHIPYLTRTIDGLSTLLS